jgi:general secretion pathway protein M
MIETAKTWFTSRSLREQRLVLVMLALLAVTVLWAAIILPVTDGLSRARTRHDAAVVLLAETEGRVHDIKALERSRPAPLGAPLDTIIRDRANAAGFALANVSRVGDDGVQIGIASARPGALMAWIAGLEDDGILTDTLTLTDNGDKTVAAQMSLRVRGS